MSPAAPPATEHTAAAPTFGQAFSVWARIGLLSFGGPAAQIALMHRVLVDERRWLGEQQFLRALSFCMLLPGPEAMQLATWAGWRMHGVRGGLAAGLLFVAPGALVVLLLAALYARYGELPLVAALFVGVKAAVLVIVVEALVRVARRALRDRLQQAIAAAAFVALFFFDLPFPLVVVAAAALGYARGAESGADAAAAAAADVPSPPAAAPVPIRWQHTVRTVLTWLAIWTLPLAALAAAVGPQHVLAQLALFFSKLAVVTFGGAYAVLAYMAQDVVQAHGWLSAGQMLDALGLAETTPGPLILVTEFVGFLAAYGQAAHAPLAMGLAGAAVTLWATFAPCFLWIFAAGPYIERLGTMPRLQAALAAITAAVVGVILNLALWFALHVLFAGVEPVRYGALRFWTPDPASFDATALLLAMTSGWLLLRLRWSVPAVLAAASAGAFALSLLA